MLSRRQALSAGLAAAATAGAASPAAANPYRLPAAEQGRLADGRPIKYRCAVVRFGEPGQAPYIHSNGAHLTLGFTDVWESGGDLFVAYDSDDIAPMLQCQVCPDERMGAANVTAGASVGNSYSRIQFGRNGQRVHAADPILKNQFTNFWIELLSLG